MPIRNVLPYSINRRLFGNRKKYGQKIIKGDMDWIQWEKIGAKFYEQNQVEGLGAKVNLAAASAIKNISLSGKSIFELGPGEMLHMKFWLDNPKHVYIADRNTDMLARSIKKLEERGIPYSVVKISDAPLRIFLEDESVDIVLSFATLEHLLPLRDYLDEFNRLMRADGLILGSIPSEGGIAWGLGRFLTTRRWFKKNTSIDPDKIICWEHPNFSDSILKAMDQRFSLESVSYWPACIPMIDINLVIKFLYRKKRLLKKVGQK